MTLEPEQRIAELERKVSDLYKALGRTEPTDWDVEASDEVRNLVASGDNLKAMQLYVQQTGKSLAEAKAAIERVAQGG